MTNDERNPTLECRKISCSFAGFVIWISSFLRISSFVIRHSDFSAALFCPVWRILQPVEHLPRFGHQQNAFVLAVREPLDSNPGRITVAEVYTLALLRRDFCGQRYPRARSFNTVFKSTQSVDVRAMSEHAPRVMLEPIPLLQKVIATMVTDFLDHLAVREADFSNVRRVDNQFATVGQDRFELVHRFAARPNLLIHLRRAREDRVE